MRKSYTYMAIAGIIVVAGIVFAVVDHSKPKNNTNNMSMNNANSNSSTNSVTTTSVTIQNFAFSPANIAVRTGMTVTWTNKDSVAHTVTETDGKQGPNSSDVNPGSNYSFTFTEPGTYHYHCSIHSEMTGTVTVVG